MKRNDMAMEYKDQVMKNHRGIEIIHKGKHTD